jgi:hypothetical protein
MAVLSRGGDGAGIVYVVEDVEDGGGVCKIGSAVNTKYRLNAIQSCNWRLLIMRYRIVVNQRFDVERRVHDALHNRRIRGEWFRITPDEARDTIIAVARQVSTTTTSTSK